MDCELIIILTMTFLLAGTIKGISGLGLPTVSLGILSLAIDLQTAMALLLVPSLVTNIWQALFGKDVGALLRRLWPFLLPATGAVWLGTALFALFQTQWLEAILGILLLLYAAAGLIGFRQQLRPLHERPIGVACGLANGVLAGLTGSFVMPGVIFLQALCLDRHRFVQAMGILFTLSTLALATALYCNGRLTLSIGLSSALGLFPAVIGMFVGSRARHLLTEIQFRRIFFGCILGLGLAILKNTVW